MQPQCTPQRDCNQLFLVEEEVAELTFHTKQTRWKRRYTQDISAEKDKYQRHRKLVKKHVICNMGSCWGIQYILEMD